MNSTSHQSSRGAARPMSRADWAVARYNWYRACGLLDDQQQNTAEIAMYQRSAEAPPPKPHLKWYPLSKPDDVTTTDQQPVTSTERHAYSRRVEAADSQLILARSQAENEQRANEGGSTPLVTHGDWAAARYNWYRACGLLGNLPQRTTEVDLYQRSQDPSPPKPHLKWYPLSTPDDDVATTYQRSVVATPAVRYRQRVVSAQAQAILARYQAEKRGVVGVSGGRPPFNSSKHPRAGRGQRIGGQFIKAGEAGTLTVGETSASGNTTPNKRRGFTTSRTKPKDKPTANHAHFSVPPEKFTDTIDEQIDLNLLRYYADGHSALGDFTDRTMMFALEHPDLWAAFVERHGLPSAKDWEMVQAWGWAVEPMPSAPKGGPYFQIDASTKTIKIADQSHAWGTAWWNYVNLTPQEQADALRQALNAVKEIGKPKNLGTLGTHDTRNASGTPYWKAWAQATALRRQFLNEIYTDLKWQLVLGGAGKALGRLDDLAAGAASLAALGKQARAAARQRFPSFIGKIVKFTSKSGRRLDLDEIKELQEYCKTFNLNVVVDPVRVKKVSEKSGKNVAAFFDGHAGEIVLGENPTLYEFLHEFCHFDQWDRMGRDITRYHHPKLNTEWHREKYVRDLLMKEFKEHLTNDDLKHAEAYFQSVADDVSKRFYGLPD